MEFVEFDCIKGYYGGKGACHVKIPACLTWHKNDIVGPRLYTGHANYWTICKMTDKEMDMIEGFDVERFSMHDKTGYAVISIHDVAPIKILDHSLGSPEDVIKSVGITYIARIHFTGNLKFAGVSRISAFYDSDKVEWSYADIGVNDRETDSCQTYNDQLSKSKAFGIVSRGDISYSDARDYTRYVLNEDGRRLMNLAVEAVAAKYMDDEDTYNAKISNLEQLIRKKHYKKWDKDLEAIKIFNETMNQLNKSIKVIVEKNKSLQLLNTVKNFFV